MNAHNNRKPIGQAHHARKAIATTATGAIVAALIVGLTVLPVEGVRADTAQVSNVEVRETVSPKQIVQYCPARMGLADTEAFGDTEFQSSVGNLQSRRRYAAFGSIFHAQSRNLTDADGVDAAVLDSPTQDDGTVAYVSSAQSAKDPSVLETRVLSAQSGTGATGALASWATEGDLPGVAASSCVPTQLQQRFLVPATTTGNTQQLMLANTSDKPTSVDIAAWGTEGEKIALATSSTVTVPANGRSTVMLNAAAPGQQALYVTVTSQNTPIGAVIRSVAMDGLTPKGNDFIMPLRGASTEQAMPIGEKWDGATVYAFARHDTKVTLSWITDHGLVAMDSFAIAAGVVATHDVGKAPKGAVAVYAQSDGDCMLAMRVTASGDEGQRDYAVVNAEPATQQAALAIPADVSANMVVANMEESQATATFVGYDASGKRVGDHEVEVDANSAVTLTPGDIGKGVVAVETTGKSGSLVWGAFLANDSIDESGLAGIAYLPAASLEVQRQTVTARNDASIVR